MLGLPASTALKKIIPKKKVLEHFSADMSPERKKRFDSEVARMMIVGEVSPVSVNLREGAEIQSFFVMVVSLKNRDFDEGNLAYIAKLFGQKLLMVLEAEGMQRLAVWQGRLLMNDWKAAESYQVALNGDNLDTAWASIVAEIAGIDFEPRLSIDEQLEMAQKRDRLMKEIEKLEKLARKEQQPRKKFELVQQIKTLRKEREEQIWIEQ